MKHILFGITILLICSGCPEKIDVVDSELTIVNQSSNQIIWSAHFRNFNDTIPYPIDSNYIHITGIEPQDSMITPSSFRNDLSTSKDLRLMVFIFSPDTLRYVPWSRIESEYLIKKRYDLTLEMLDSMNWRIIYQ